MNVLIIISTLFVIGSIIGYILEVIFRGVVEHKLVNPGFLLGPYLPIYGIGVILLYGISNISLSMIPLWAAVLIKILLIGISMTLIEFIGGLIFIRKLHINLWDYSHMKGNIMGIISPIFSLIWLVIGSLYYFFLNPLLVEGITFISHYTIYSYFIGIVIGMMLVDLAYSIHLASRLKRFKEIEYIRFDALRTKILGKIKKFRKNR